MCRASVRWSHRWARVGFVLAAAVLAWAGTAVAAGGWAVQPAPAPPGPATGKLLAVSCVSSRYCVAVGSHLDRFGREVTLVERWDGASWTIQPSPNPDGAATSVLSGVSCTSTRACVVVGKSSGPGNGPEVTLAERWNGSKWSVMATPNPRLRWSSTLSAVSCPEANSCTAVGFIEPDVTSYLNTRKDLAADQRSRALVERWDGSGWSIEPTPRLTLNGHTAFSELLGVSCVSRTACVAVGSRATRSGHPTLALAERWNGVVWTAQPGVNPAGSNYNALSGVSCLSREFCTAVGSWDDVEPPGGGGALVVHWNGSRWAVRTAAGLNANPTSVSCVSGRACLAVGSPDGGFAWAESWNGSRWSARRVPRPAGAIDSALAGISCPSSRVCIAVGSRYPKPGGEGSIDTLAERWNGASWSIHQSVNEPGPGGATLDGVSCGSASTCTAVGSSEAGTLLAEQWNGTSWTLQDPPVPAGAVSSELDRVSCPSARFCAAVGNYTTKPGAQGLPLFETWNGASWSSQSPGPGPIDVSCTSATDCTGVGGNSGTSASAGLAEHWNGTGWSIEPTPNLPAGTEGGLDSVSCTSPTACTAVGASGNPDGGVVTTLAERWNGTSWTIQSTPNKVDGDGSANALSAVSCASDSVCTAVGYWQQYCHDLVCQGGLAQRWNGTTWTSQHISDPMGRPALFDAVSCPTSTDCTAITSPDFNGGTGTATWTGADWTIEPEYPLTIAPFFVTTLNDISCTSTSACTAVGTHSPFSWTVAVPLALRYS